MRFREQRAGCRRVSVACHECMRDFAVMALPVPSGYVLGLRLCSENDFAPTCRSGTAHPGDEWCIHAGAGPGRHRDGWKLS